MPTDPAPIDPAGQPLPMGTIRVVFYDSAGRVIHTADPPGTITYTTYLGGSNPPAPTAPEPPGPGDTPPDEPHVVG